MSSSEAQTPQAATRSSTSPGPGSGGAAVDDVDPPGRGEDRQPLTARGGAADSRTTSEVGSTWRPPARRSAPAPSRSSSSDTAVAPISCTRLAHGGERRRGHHRQRRVVEADDGDVAGDGAARGW